MKKIINYSGIPGLILISALFFLPVSCNKDTVKDNSDVDNSSLLIKVSGEDAGTATKTTLNGLVTSWKADDKVGIYSAEARTTYGGVNPIVNALFTAASTGATSNFTGTMYWGTAGTSHTFYAYYPYAVGSAASTIVPVSLATAQTQLEANNSAHIGALDFMVATPVTVTSLANIDPIANTVVSLRYNHVFTVLEFQIKGTGSLKAVKLSTNGILTFSGGTIDISQSIPTSGHAYTLASLIGSSTQAVVTLTTQATLTATNTDTRVYMVIVPGTPLVNCVIGLSADGTTWKYLNKTALAGGLLRGNKYVVAVNADDTPNNPIDGDGNSYPFVTIGTQDWLASNLKTTKYNDGSAIPNVDVVATWAALSIGAYCDYSNTSSNSDTYGRLYNWYALDNNEATKGASNGGKNICPTGWHVPSDTEWTTLATSLGNWEAALYGEDPTKVLLAGGKLKETGITHWTNPNTDATNSSGFTALPGGFRDQNGTFSGIFGMGSWWSSEVSNWDLYNYSGDVRRFHNDKRCGFSVRCVRN